MLNNHATPRRPGFWLAITVAAIALPLLAACATAEPSAPSDPSANAATEPVAINLPIVNRETGLTRDDLRVSRGDTVALTVTADEPGEVHLHGYDLSAQVSPGQPGGLLFTADTAGAFALNFHVFGAAGMADSTAGGNHHSDAEPEPLELESPASIAISAVAEADGGVSVSINTEGFRLAPELVDQAHTPDAGHAHIYVDGEKLGRVFDMHYGIDPLPPGEHEIRVSLNTNDHQELTYGGRKLEATTTVSVPDVGQKSANSDGDAPGHHDGGQDGDGDGGSHHGSGQNNDQDGAAAAIIAEVHLGNLEVYP